MKLYVLLPAVLFLISCSGGAPPQQPGKATKEIANTEKNKQIALRNEVIETTQAAQKLEKQGRDMESFRQAIDAESARQCRSVMEERQRQAKELEAKVNNFPNPFNSYLTPIIADLNACVSCSKTAMTSCVKTRAELNKAIEEMFPK